MFSNIYLITNIINSKKYVGQSVNVKQRWNEHKYNSKSKNTNIALYIAIKKYGIENFTIEILESNVDINEVDDREKYWIKTLNTFKPNGYNLTLGREGTLGYKLSDDTKKKISVKTKERFNNMTDEEKLEMINRLPKNGYDLEKMNQGYKNWLSNLSKEEKIRLYKQIVKTKKEKGYDFYNFSFGKMNSIEKEKMYRKISQNNPRKKCVLMLDDKDNIIKEFHSIGEAARYLNKNYGYSLNSKNNIRAYLNLDKKIYGYKWKHK